MDLLAWLVAHWWQTLGSTGLGTALATALTRGGLWRWCVRQFRLNKAVTDLQGEVTERTRERDEAIRARDDAYRAAATMRVLLEDLQASTRLALQASTLVTSADLPNPLAPSSPTSPPSPPGSSPSPERRAPPLTIPPR
jgi:hypothetical protein